MSIHKANGPYAINHNAQTEWHHTRCSICNKSFTWKNTNGSIPTKK